MMRRVYTTTMSRGLPAGSRRIVCRLGRPFLTRVSGFDAGVGLIVIFLAAFVGGHSAVAASLKKQTRLVYLGNYCIKLVQYRRGDGKNFVHLHQNETTAKQAALAYVNKYGGSLLTLIHAGDRNIHFILRHQYYEFDPNRIFTDIGIKKTLRQNSHYSPAALIEVKKLSRAILRWLPHGKIVAVHNNREYSMKNYFPDHDMAFDVRAMQARDAASLRNFYLVTQQKAFLHLQRLRQNVVWQSLQVQDDGSLSVVMASRDYVNVEAAYEAFRQQFQMLRLA